MDEDDLAAQIALLEVQIEAFAETLERCRKIMLASKLAIGAGFVLTAVTLTGMVGFNPAAILTGMTAVIGGIVVFGSNTSTARQTTTNMQAAAAQRAQLIGMLNLRLVNETVH